MRFAVLPAALALLCLTGVAPAAGQGVQRVTLRLDPALRAPDADHGHFFVVFTLSTGQPPQMKATGTGLDAAARVGQRTVRWDGKAITID